MTQEEVRKWCLEHGFSDKDGVLTAHWGDELWNIEFLTRSVRRTVHRNGNRIRGSTIHPKNLQISAITGVLVGLGLESGPTMRVLRGASPPPWFPAEYSAKLTELQEKS